MSCSLSLTSSSVTSSSSIMPKRKQQPQSIEKWLLQCQEGKSHLYTSKQEALQGVETHLMDSDVITFTLKRVHVDNDVQLYEQDASMKAYHASSPQHLHLENSIDLDLIDFEDDLEDILLDDTMMNEMHEKIDWHEACCTFLKNIITPKKEQLQKHHDWKDARSGGSPITNLFLRREES